MRTIVDVVFQNLDGDGLPTQTGDVVLTCEAPHDKDALRERLGKMEHWFPEKNYRMTASWRPRFRLVEKRRIKVHKASDEPPSPRRDILVTTLDIDGETSLISGHAVNSAWAPRWKRTTFRKERRALWLAWRTELEEAINSERAKGRRVVVVIDGNRSGRWHLIGVRVVWKHGPDRILVSEGIECLQTWTGPRTGNGRVTHPSIRVRLALL
jgi:hypothetical protein